MTVRYDIRFAKEADLVLLSCWRSRAHVARWWGEPALESEVKKREPRITTWIAELEGRPFAFIQDYLISDWWPHHFDYLPLGSRGMDICIGELDLLGLGHGSRLVRQHVAFLFNCDVPAVGIDPSSANRAAVRTFERAGFTAKGRPRQTRWGRSQRMDIRA